MSGKRVFAQAANLDPNVSLQLISLIIGTLSKLELEKMRYKILLTILIIIIGFIGCCCPPIGNYFIAEKINATDIEKYIGCIDWTGCTGFLGSAIGLFMMRQKIRQNDGMDKGEIGDMVKLYCCLPCTICQTAIHVGIDD